MRELLAPAPRLAATEETAKSETGAPVAVVELLFFAYRDFVGEPDRLLSRYGFGRAHHRVLHFVARNPGLTIAELLQILDITKQSLARVLRDLVEGGFVDQRPGEEDRRQRLLFLTATGETLAAELLALQSARVARALQPLGPADRQAVERFLLELVDGRERGKIARIIRRTPAAANGESA